MSAPFLTFLFFRTGGGRLLRYGWAEATAAVGPLNLWQHKIVIEYSTKEQKNFKIKPKKNSNSTTSNTPQRHFRHYFKLSAVLFFS